MNVKIMAVAYRSELEFGKDGIGWLFFGLFGSRGSFFDKTDTAPHLTVLPTYRADGSDLTCRVPSATVLSTKSIAIVGTGAVGAPVAIELARNFCGKLYLIEHDRIEPGNTIRWPLGVSAWGRAKLSSLNEFMRREYPATEVQIYPHRVGGIDGDGDANIFELAFSDVDLIVDASASHGVTNALAEQARERNVPLVSLWATPNLEGGAVVRHTSDGGCPNCMEHALHEGQIPPCHHRPESVVAPPM